MTTYECDKCNFYKNNKEGPCRRVGCDGTVKAVTWVPASRVEELKDIIARYEDGITWDTTCSNCANLLNGSYHDYTRAEQAEAENKRMRIILAELGYCPNDGDTMPCMTCGAGL